MRHAILLFAALAAPAWSTDRARLAARLAGTEAALRWPALTEPTRLRDLILARAALRTALAQTPPASRPFTREERERLDDLAALPVPALPVGPARYRPPVPGRLVSRSGAALLFETRAGEPVRAPAAGRIAFVGRYRGYGEVVILDHGGGWKTLLTGFAAAPGATGDMVPQGGIVGRAATGPLSLELRRAGRAVDPVRMMVSE